MSTITCLKELNKRECLELDDIVIFTINEEKIEYRIQDDYLHNIKGYKDNDEIFIILDIDKYEIAEKAYKYKTNKPNSIWPTSKNKDYPALTRLIRELYTIIEEKNKVYTKYNRFEIMDI